MKFIRPLALFTMVFCASPVFAQDSAPAQPVLEDVQIVAEAEMAPDTTPKYPLSDEQRHKLMALRDQYELDTALKQAQLRVSERQLHELLHEVKVDKQAALSLQSKINALRAELSTAKLNLVLAAGDVFTPEQRAEFKKMHHGRYHHGCSAHGCSEQHGGPGHHGGHEYRHGHGGPGHGKPLSGHGAADNSFGPIPVGEAGTSADFDYQG